MGGILLLGGTSEAVALAAEVARTFPEATCTTSLAGRTRVPQKPAGDLRVGGFGGAGGLADWLRAHRIRAVVDATHPFAARISENAARACAARSVPLLRLVRPPWERQEGDLWHSVADETEAAQGLPSLISPRGGRVLLAIGSQRLAPFAARTECDFVVRLADEPSAAARSFLPHARWVVARGPFERRSEEEFFARHEVSALVTRNSGGAATYGKIAVARARGVRVMMIARPPEAAAAAQRAGSVPEALAWLRALKIFS